MAAVLERVVPGLRVGTEVVDAITAIISGAIDGYCLKKDLAWAFILKNIGIPIAGLFVPAIPKGMKDHSVGQLGMLITLLIS